MATYNIGISCDRDAWVKIHYDLWDRSHMLQVAGSDDQPQLGMSVGLLLSFGWKKIEGKPARHSCDTLSVLGPFPTKNIDIP